MSLVAHRCDLVAADVPAGAVAAARHAQLADRGVRVEVGATRPPAMNWLRLFCQASSAASDSAGWSGCRPGWWRACRSRSGRSTRSCRGPSRRRGRRGAAGRAGAARRRGPRASRRDQAGRGGAVVARRARRGRRGSRRATHGARRTAGRSWSRAARRRRRRRCARTRPGPGARRRHGWRAARRTRGRLRGARHVDALAEQVAVAVAGQHGGGAEVTRDPPRELEGDVPSPGSPAALDHLEATSFREVPFHRDQGEDDVGHGRARTSRTIAQEALPVISTPVPAVGTPGPPCVPFGHVVDRARRVRSGRRQVSRPL